MRTITTVVGPLATVVANSVALAQAVLAAGPLNLNGSAVVAGAAILNQPSRVTIACNDGAGPVYRIEGRDLNGRPFGETLVATGVTSTTVNLFSAVTAVYVDRSLVNNVTVGNDNGGASEPIRLDEWADPPVGCQVVVNGVANFTVQTSFDNPNDPVSPVPWNQMFWDTSLVPPAAVGGSVSMSFAVPTAPLWMRLLLNSGSGSARLTASQFNVVEV